MGTINAANLSLAFQGLCLGLNQSKIIAVETNSRQTKNYSISSFCNTVVYLHIRSAIFRIPSLQEATRQTAASVGSLIACCIFPFFAAVKQEDTITLGPIIIETSKLRLRTKKISNFYG